MSNISTLAADTIAAGSLDIGDAGGNVYVGSNAGVVYATNSTNFNNVGLGVGAGAGISNVSNSVFIGSNAGYLLTNANETTIIGTNDTVVGTRNVIIGNRDFVYGDNNLIIGSDISTNESYRLNIGNLILGDISLGGQLEFNANVIINGTLGCTAFDASGLATTNVIVPGYIRNAALTGINMDISEGGFNFTGTGPSRVADVSFYRGRVDASAGIHGSGYDLSSGLTLTGNISNSGTVTASNFLGTSSASNSIGGVTLNNTTISNAGSTTSANFFGTSSASNSIGGVTLSNTNISYAGTIIGSTDNTSNKIGGVTLSNTNISYAGTIIGSTDNTSNRIGGVTLSNTNVNNISTITATNAIVSGYLRNALVPTQFDISGGNISNSGTTRASNFIGTSAASNSIGGVTLNNTTISNAGSTTSSNFVTPTASSNSIGGVTLSNTNITTTGIISSTTAGQSNIIGGVTLWNNNISNSGTTTSSNFIGTSAASNSIGGIVLSNGNAIVSGFLRNALVPTQFDISGGNISNSATHTSSNFIGTATASNSIGGVVLSNSNAIVGGFMRNALVPTQFDISGGNISNSATHTSSNFIGTAAASNNIGGVTLSNSNAIVGGFLRNALVPTQFDISGGNISNSATHTSSNFIGTSAASNSIGGVTLSNGRVGIGPSAPQYSLDISTSSANQGIQVLGSNAQLNLRDPGQTSAMQFFQNSTTQGIFIQNTNPLHFFHAGVAQLVISNSNVGIGTLTPGSALTVVGNISNSGTTTSSNFVGTSAASNSIGGVTLSNTNITTTGIISSTTAGQSNIIGGVTLWNNNVSNSGTTTSSNFFGTSAASNSIGGVTLSNTNILAGSGTAGAPSYAFTSGTNTGLYFPAVGKLGLSAGGFARMTISGGLVGIGTATPLTPLDVEGVVTVSKIGNAASGNTPWIVEGSSRGGIYFQKSDNNNFGFAFYTALSSVVAERMRIDGATGRIGIGTAGPLYTLDVCATAGSAAVNMNTWPRASVSNVLIARGMVGVVGNTINWSNTPQNTIDTNLMTAVLSNATTGCSFKVLKSGVWSFKYTTSSVTNQNYTWIDVSTNDNSNVAFAAAGNPYIGFGQAALNYIDVNFTGYLPSNSTYFYKIRHTATPVAGNAYYLQIAFLYETAASAGTFPF